MALNEYDDITDMLKTAGLHERTATEEELMLGLPSQSQGPVTIEGMNAAFAAARKGKKSETKFKTVSNKFYKYAEIMVGLVEVCVEEMERSAKKQERRCADVLRCEFISYETMDTIENNTRKILTYEDKAKHLGIPRRTYINRKDQGIEFFAERFFLKLKENKEDFQEAISMITTKEKRKVIEEFSKSKARGREIDLQNSPENIPEIVLLD